MTIAVSTDRGSSIEVVEGARHVLTASNDDEKAEGKDGSYAELLFHLHLEFEYHGYGQTDGCCLLEETKRQDYYQASLTGDIRANVY